MKTMERRVGARRIAGMTAAGAVVALIGAATPARAAAPFIPVTTTTSNADNGSDGQCTLVEAVKALNNSATYHECIGGSAYNVVTLPSGTITSNVVVSVTRTLGTIQGNGLTASTITFGNVNNS